MSVDGASRWRCLRAIAWCVGIFIAAAAPAQGRDVLAPAAPAWLRAKAVDGRVVLTWAPSRDNAGLRAYRLYRRAARRGWPRRHFAAVAASKRRHMSTPSPAGGRYVYRVRAVDRAGNVSRASKSAVIELSAGVDGPSDRASTGCETSARSGEGRWPAACWRPFASTSPFNRPIPDGAPLAPNSAAIVDRLLSWGRPQSLLAGHADTEHDYFHPIYHSDSRDPLYTVRCVRWTSSCTVEGAQVRIPGAARAAGGGDGHMAVIDQDSGWEYDFWQVRSKPRGGGVITISHGGRTRLDGDGLGVNATAAWFALSAGIIRAAEMRAGRIDHALFTQIKCTAGSAVYPAEPSTTAAPCEAFGLSNRNAPALGARIFLDMSDSEIDALAVPPWKKTILRALAEYGMIVGDTNGGNAGWGLQGESGSSYTSFGASDPWRSFARSVDAPTWDGVYAFDIGSGVDWRRLRVVAPCASRGSC